MLVLLLFVIYFVMQALLSVDFLIYLDIIFKCLLGAVCVEGEFAPK